MHILCPVIFVVANCAVYEMMWKNIVETGGPHMTIWRMRVTHRYLKLQKHTQNI